MIAYRPFARPVGVQSRLLWSSTPIPRTSASRRCLSHTSVRLLGKPSQSDSASKGTLPDKPAITRFAPSPTGYLHLGSLRTALYNYLLARATKGRFILRIEDTDQTRLVPDAEARLYDDLRWCGLEWDEGPDQAILLNGPYRQSQRLPIYRKHVDLLLSQDKAFRCFCSKEDLERQKAEMGTKAHSMYPGACLGISAAESDERAAKGEAHVVRFKSPSKPITITDHVYGKYTKGVKEDDFIIMKSDGFPTYHLANVVDDHFMNVTHVVRGAEWLISTPMHEALYQAFGWQPPVFAHLGLLFNKQGQKLSKRDGSIDIGYYRQISDYFPQALVNFVAMHGWNPMAGSAPLQSLGYHSNSDPEQVKSLLRMDELIERFSMKFTKGDIKVDMGTLGAIQKAQTHNLLTSRIPDERSKAIVVQSARTMIRQIQQTAASAKEQGTVVPIPARNERDPNKPKLLEKTNAAALSLNLVPRLQDLDSKEAEKYILDALAISRHDLPLVSAKIAADRMLFFRLEESALKKSYNKLLAQIHGVHVMGRDKKLIDAMRIISVKLADLPTTDGEWSSAPMLLDDAIAYLEPRISYTKRRQGSEKKWQSAAIHFLRWALLDLNPGPAIVPLLKFLGRKEVMHRLDRVMRAITKADMPGAEGGMIRRITKDDPLIRMMQNRQSIIGKGEPENVERRMTRRARKEWR